MENSTISDLNLSSLSDGIPALPSKKAAQRMEACVWCLLECEHENGVLIDVINHNLEKNEEAEKKYKLKTLKKSVSH